MRLDGLYGDAAVLSAVLDASLGLIGRSRNYALLDLAEVQAVLARPPVEVCTHPESGALRALYDCPDIPLTAGGPRVRLIVASHPATSTPQKIGKKRNGVIFELFVTRLTAPAFSAKDVLDLYLHRGSFETVLADEDVEQDPDRWCSHSPCGQEFWQILSQWVWNLRLELGERLSPTQMRTTEFAPAFVSVLLNGPASHLPEVFPVQLLHRNRMEACSALPIILSPHKNADPSAMGRCVCCMPLALVIVATAFCGRSVKKTFSRSNPGESVPFPGRSRPTRCEVMHRFSDLLNHPHFLQCCGAIGPVVTSGVTGCVWCDPKQWE